MKVKFLKRHLDFNEGDVAEVDYNRGRYFINTKVAELADGEAGEGPAKQKVAKKKTLKPKGPKKARKPKAENKNLAPITEVK